MCPPVPCNLSVMRRLLCSRVLRTCEDHGYLRHDSHTTCEYRLPLFATHQHNISSNSDTSLFSATATRNSSRQATNMHDLNAQEFNYRKYLPGWLMGLPDPGRMQTIYNVSNILTNYACVYIYTYMYTYTYIYIHIYI